MVPSLVMCRSALLMLKYFYESIVVPYIEKVNQDSYNFSKTLNMLTDKYELPELSTVLSTKAITSWLSEYPGRYSLSLNNFSGD